MADQVVGLRIQADGKEAVQTVGNIKKELRAAQQEAIALSQKFGETSTEALEAARKVAQLRDAVADTNERIALFDPGAKFAVFGNVLRTVAGGFSALTGAVALFGVESKEVEKTLLKVQAALAITEGINTIADAGKDFQRLTAFIQQSTVAQKLFAVSTTLTSTAFKGLGISVAASSTAFKVLRTAIITTGIGALVIGIGLLIDKVSQWTSSTDDAAAAQDRLKEATDKLNQSLQDQIGFTDRAARENIARAKAQGASEKELTAIERKAIEDRIFLREVALQDAKVKGIDETELAKQLAEEKQNLRIFDFDQQAKALEKQRQLNEKANAAARAAADKAREEKKKRDKEAADAERKRIDDLRKLKAEEDALLAQVPEEEKKKTDDGDLQAKQNELFRKLAFDRLNIRQQEEEKIYQQYQQDLQLAEGNELLKFELTQKFEKDKADLKDKYRREDEEKERLSNQAKAQIISGALGTIADAVGRQTAAGKALGIAQATIDGFLAVQKALASAPPPFNFIAAGAVGIATIANIRKIATTQIPGQSGGGGNVPSSLAPAAPSIPQRAITGATTLDQNSLNQIGNATTRAFVVESDVTNNQERITRLNRAARLG